MTQEQKDLLLKDLCARLPYGVKVRYSSYEKFITCTLHAINPVYHIVDLWSEKACFNPVDTSKIKPYLFPLSSMTEEQAKELFNIFGLVCPSTEEDYIKINECTGITFFLCQGFDVETHLDKLTDWLNKNHFDYRGLIEKGLAIDATNLNIYKKLKS